MRILPVLICALLFALPAGAEEEPTKIDLESNASHAVEIFRNACFVNFAQRHLSLAYLNKNYTKMDGDKKKEFLGFVHAADGGDVWAVPPKLVHTVISENNGNCYVVSHIVDAAMLHKEMKELALDVKESLTFSVIDYHPPKKDSNPAQALFEFKAPDGSVFFTVVAVTKENPETHIAESVISIMAPPKETAAEIRR